MDARRLRVLTRAAFAAGLLATSLAAPVEAADCALSAPATVNVGSTFTIEGSGFPASTSIDIDFAIDGGASDAFSVQSDATGALQIALVPEDIDIGVTTVQATAGSTCTASVTYTVLAAGATPPPAATESPASGTGSEPTAPQTDSDAIGGRNGSAGLRWILALALVGVGSAGLFLTRLPRRR